MQTEKTESNRRDFLKTGTALAAAAIVSPALGYASSSSPDDTLQNSKNSTGRLQNRILGKGKNSLEVSALGLGCMGMVYDRGIPPDRKTMISLIRKAYDQGVTFFDTAEVYGPFLDEELVGEALAPMRKKVVIATKFGFKYNANGQPNPKGGFDSRPEQIKKVVDNCLKRLKTDYIDLLYQHRNDPAVPIQEVAGTIKELVQQGKVKHYGLSEADPITIRQAHSVHPMTALQSEYSLMWRKPEETVIPVCQELGIGFVAYSPIGRGYLSGLLNEQTKFYAPNDNRAENPRYTAEAMKNNRALVDALYDFSHPRGMSTTQVALAWLLAQKDWIVSIPGTTKFGHLLENLSTVDMPLSLKDVQLINDTTSKITIFGERV